MNHRLPLCAFTFLLAALASSSAWADRPKVLIVALGDSTTAGTPFFLSPLESPPDGQGDPEGQYAYWMMHKHPQWTVLNYGINGQTSTQILARMPDALKLGPRYIIILAGVNDIYQGRSIKEVADNLLAMYKKAQGQDVMPVAATVLPFNEATPTQSKAIDALNDWIKKAADKMNMPMADLNAAVRDPKDPTHLESSPDGLHPDVGGYRKMGMALTNAIEPIEKAWR